MYFPQLENDMLSIPGRGRVSLSASWRTEGSFSYLSVSSLSCSSFKFIQVEKSHLPSRNFHK
jgi:hypothetical protein